MKIRWTRPALNDLLEAQTYIAKDNPPTAQTVAQRLWDTAQDLESHPQIGRPGYASGTLDATGNPNRIPTEALSQKLVRGFITQLSKPQPT